jgi:hypothetical protein
MPGEARLVGSDAGQPEMAPAWYCASITPTISSRSACCSWSSAAVPRAACRATRLVRTRPRTCQATDANVRRAASERCRACAIRWPRLPAVSIVMSSTAVGIQGDGVRVVTS